MARGILITGASSGIGKALALAYAAPGVVLFLAGRDAVRLEAVAEICEQRGARVHPRVIDVTDRVGMAVWLAEVEMSASLDLVIANAGISGGTGHPEGEGAAQTREIFAVNVEGVLNTILPAIGPMRAKRSGQVVIISSLASFRGLPTAPAYAASKAAVRVWGEGLRGWLAADGIGVSVVCPGFVKSHMTEHNRFPMPFLMTTERAAQTIKQGIDANRPRISFPWPMAAIIWLLSLLPLAWTDRWLSILPSKE